MLNLADGTAVCGYRETFAAVVNIVRVVLHGISHRRRSCSNFEGGHGKVLGTVLGLQHASDVKEQSVAP